MDNQPAQSRRDTIKCGISTAAALAVSNLSLRSARGQETPEPPREFKRPSRLDLALVQQFVGVCHRDLDTVKAMLKQEPGLSNASWNLGGGDWERGMEAAAHMGRPDIADTLIQYKARKCVYWAAMVGEEAIVKAFVTSDPDIVNTGGAHGISLMAHAAICGKIALTQFLMDSGAKPDNKSLAHAVRHNHLEMVEWFVAHGVDPSAKGLGGRFLYDIAQQRGYTKIAAFLRERATQ